jgi:hypothetical protein
MVPFLTDQKMISFTLIAQDLKADRPYLFDVTDNFPTYHITDLQYIKKAHPDLTKMAILSQDDEIGVSAVAWSEAAAETEGFQIVYDKPFGLDTTDFAPIVTAAIKSDPDIINLGACYPEYKRYLRAGVSAGVEGHHHLRLLGLRRHPGQGAQEFMGCVSTRAKTTLLEGRRASPDRRPRRHTGRHALEFWDEWKTRWLTTYWSRGSTRKAADIWVWAAQRQAASIRRLSSAPSSRTSGPHTLGGMGEWLGGLLRYRPLLHPVCPSEIRTGAGDRGLMASAIGWQCLATRDRQVPDNGICRYSSRRDAPGVQW